MNKMFPLDKVCYPVNDMYSIHISRNCKLLHEPYDETLTLKVETIFRVFPKWTCPPFTKYNIRYFEHYYAKNESRNEEYRRELSYTTNDTLDVIKYALNIPLNQLPLFLDASISLVNNIVNWRFLSPQPEGIIHGDVPA